MPLWTRSVSADVTISGQFAATKLKLVFQNESSHQMEAEFVYELPPGAVATHFAYWAGEEKVVARVVEKEEARKIYETIVNSWRRDPALLEMTGKNTFRARIFPVLPNDDLKVEICTVQVMPSDANGTVYTAPIFDPGALDPLDSIDIRIDIRPDPTIDKVTTNYGIPIQHTDAGYVVSLCGENYRPPKDLNVRIARKPAKMYTSLYAAPSGGGDGFFALALIPDHTLENPSVSINGIKTYEVSPSRLPKVKANTPLTVYGRYKGSDNATVTLRGRSAKGWVTYSAPLRFGSQPEPDNLAARLWAAARIEQLSANNANRAAVVDISKRFGMPSKYTSWLAVPADEMKNYRQEEYRAKIDTVADPLLELYRQGKEDTQQARALRDKLNETCKELGMDPCEELRNRAYDIIGSINRQMVADAVDGKDTTAHHERLRRLFGMDYAEAESFYWWDVMQELARRIVEQEHSDSPDLQQIKILRDRMEQIAAAHNQPVETNLQYAEDRYLANRPYKLASQLLDLIKEGRADSPEARKAREELEACGRGDSPVRDYLQFTINDVLVKKCDELPELIETGGDAEAAVSELTKELQPAAREAGVDLTKRMNEYIASQAQKVAEKLAGVVADGKESTPEGKMLNRQLQVLSKISGTDASQTFGMFAECKLAELAQRLAPEQRKAKPDQRVITDLKQQIKRLEERSGKSAAKSIREAEKIMLQQEMWGIEYELAEMIIDGKGDTKPAQALRTRYYALCGQFGRDPKKQLKEEIEIRMSDLAWEYAEAKYRERPDTVHLALLEKRMQAIERLTGLSAREAIDNSEEYGLRAELESLQGRINSEMERKNPNTSRLKRLEDRYKSLAPQYKLKGGDEYKAAYVDDYAAALGPAVDTRIEVITLEKQIQAAKAKGDTAKLTQLEKKHEEVKAAFDKHFSDLRLAARWGDPLIAVDAPEDALRVIALMPDGEIKVLEYNTDMRRWEARFDIPLYAAEGEYAIKVIAVLKDGTRRQMALSYNVDLTPPTGTPIALDATNRRLRLEIMASEDTARAVALLSWGERVEMRSSSEQGKFYAIVDVPAGYEEALPEVSYILTDSAHNRTTITVELSK